MTFGGAITPGTYRATGAVLGSAYGAQVGGVCMANTTLEPLVQTFRLAPTSNPRVFDYEMIRGRVQLDGGAAGMGSERGSLVLNDNDQSLAFLDVTCTDAGTPLNPDGGAPASVLFNGLPRAFTATATTILIDCCRVSSLDAGPGSLPATNAAYMIEFTRQ